MQEKIVDNKEVQKKLKAQDEAKEKMPQAQSIRDEFDLDAATTEAEMRLLDAEKKFRRAGLKFELGDLDEALMLLRSALSISPGNAKYHYNAGFLYWRKDLLEVAVNHYKMFLKYAPPTDKDYDMIASRVTYLEGEIKKRRNIR